MSTQTLFCFANSPLHAHHVVDWLKQEGFSTQDISACLPQKSVTLSSLCKDETIPFSSNMCCGRELPSHGRPVTVLGRKLLKSPRATTRSFNSSGSLASFLMAKGFSEPIARRCEVEVQGGGILISVHAASPSRMSRAKKILELAGTQDIAAVAAETRSEVERPAA